MPRGPRMEVSSYLLHLKTGAKAVCRNVVVLIDNYPSVYLILSFVTRRYGQDKVTAIPAQAWTDTGDSSRLKLPDFQTNCGKVVSPRHRPALFPRKYLCHRLSRSQGHSVAGRFMPTKNSSDNIGNRTRDLPACSAVPQPTAPARAQITAKRMS